jgi:integrase
MGVKVHQKDGKWYVRVNHQKQRKSKCVGSSKQVAELVKRQIEAKLALGDLGVLQEAPKPVLFGDYTRQWLETYVSRALKPSSARIMRATITNHLLPTFGTRALAHITRADVKAFVATKGHVSTAHLRNILRVLSAILSHALDDELITTHPAARLGWYLQERHTHASERLMPFTSLELARYMAAMQAHYPQYYPCFMCLARTGMRKGEALGLIWDDIQFGLSVSDPYRFVHVQRTYDSVQHLMNTSKSGKTRRVDMAQDLRACLLEWRGHCTDQAHLAGKTALWPAVFATASGRPWEPVRLHSVHTRVCALAGLRANRIHDLRHSYATILLYELHAPIQYVSEQLGHSSIKITVDTYGHPRQGMSTHLVDQLGTPMPHSATVPQLDDFSVR